MILVLRYLRLLRPDDHFLNNENDKLQRDIAAEVQDHYNDQAAA